MNTAAAHRGGDARRLETYEFLLAGPMRGSLRRGGPAMVTLAGMSKTIIVAGYGPGISHAVAERFGRAGFSLALVARTAAKLTAAAERFKAAGVEARALAADLTDLASVRKVVASARAALGPITVLHWNAATPAAGDLLGAPAEELSTSLVAGAVGLVAAVQEALPDLRNKPDSAVLVTNGGFGLFVDAVDAMAVDSGSMGLAVANSAKHKVSRLLAKRLEREGVFLGEVMVKGLVKGTAWDRGGATLEASTVADRFWGLYEHRREHFTDAG
jgi:NAD(P)-dependent dehydrogenase (short-subunit alcohol dehydrogenase family)